MLGALAWQITKSLIKVHFFGFFRGRSHGVFNFFNPGFSPLSVFFCLPLCLHVHKVSDCSSSPINNRISAKLLFYELILHKMLVKEGYYYKDWRCFSFQRQVDAELLLLRSSCASSFLALMNSSILFGSLFC